MAFKKKNTHCTAVLVCGIRPMERINSNTVIVERKYDNDVM